MTKSNYRLKVNVVTLSQELRRAPSDEYFLERETESAIQAMVDEGWTYRGPGSRWNDGDICITQLVFVRKELKE